MGCFTKFALFTTNFIIFAIGVVVVALSSVIISKDSTYGVLLSEGTFSLPIVILIAGLIILLIGFLGCCGVMQGSSCMLKMYAGIVIILLIGEVVMGILILVYSNQAESIFEDTMTKVFKGYGNGDKSSKKAIDEAQNAMKCCGVTNYTDWETYPYGMDHNDSVADGCCKGDFKEGCGIGILSETDFKDKIYTDGCWGVIKEDIKGASIGLGVTCLILAIVQCISVSMACGIAKDLH